LVYSQGALVDLQLDVSQQIAEPRLWLNANGTANAASDLNNAAALGVMMFSRWFICDGEGGKWHKIYWRCNLLANERADAQPYMPEDEALEAWQNFGFNGGRQPHQPGHAGTIYCPFPMVELTPKKLFVPALFDAFASSMAISGDVIDLKRNWRALQPERQHYHVPFLMLAPANMRKHSAADAAADLQSLTMAQRLAAVVDLEQHAQPEVEAEAAQNAANSCARAAKRRLLQGEAVIVNAVHAPV
jgi:hypothetical protein